MALHSSLLRATAAATPVPRGVVPPLPPFKANLKPVRRRRSFGRGIDFSLFRVPPTMHCPRTKREGKEKAEKYVRTWGKMRASAFSFRGAAYENQDSVARCFGSLLRRTLPRGMPPSPICRSTHAPILARSSYYRYWPNPLRFVAD